MARTYGFRVFIVEAYPNRVKGNQPYNAGAGSLLYGEIAHLLQRLQGKGTQQYLPRPAEDGSIDKPTKTATLKSFVEVSPSMIHATISVGETGSHATATRPKKKTRDLKNWSPEADHDVTFIFPDGKESRFFLVTQTIHRRDPHLRLLAMLRAESMIVRTEREASDAATRRAAIASGGKAPTKQTFKRLLFEAKQASDNAYLDEILTNADSASVVFKSKKMDAKGAVEYVDRVLQIKLRDENIFDVGRRVGRVWTERLRSGASADPHSAVSEVSDVLIEHDLLDEGEDEKYESAAITVKRKSEASTTIAVDTLRDAFTYPLSDLRPSWYTYYEQVGGRTQKIALQESIQIHPIDPHEVSRCLTDSTQAGS
jgi:hypothetical protein